MEKSLEQLLDQNWYLSPNIKTAILAKAKKEDYTDEKVERLKVMVIEMNAMQDTLIQKIVEEDPLFFAEFDHELQAEAFEKIRSLENPEHQAEMNSVEAELEAFLKEE